MSLSVIRSWVNRLPKAERDMPLIVVDSTAYTPNEVLEEVRKGTELGERLQTKVETRELGTPEDLQTELAKERIKKILEERPVDVIRLTVPGEDPEKTAERLKEDIDTETDFARKLIDQEKSYIDRLRRV